MPDIIDHLKHIPMGNAFFEPSSRNDILSGNSQPGLSIPKPYVVRAKKNKPDAVLQRVRVSPRLKRNATPLSPHASEAIAVRCWKAESVAARAVNYAAELPLLRPAHSPPATAVP